jgi:mannose-1-phosphate guanylyltransferase/phosphomannomutase
MTNMKGFILAAGFGTRLWPLTEDRTKAAIPVLNRPLIDYSVEYLASFGIRDLIVNLHHQPDSIRKALGDGSRLAVNITYSFEETILGTSGALDVVRESLLEDDFVVINGKIVTDIDLGRVIAVHREQKAIATLVLRSNAAYEHFSIVEVDQQHRITRFAGFPDAVAVSAEVSTQPGVVATVEDPPLMFTGIQVLSPRIFDYIPRGQFSHSTIHVFPQAIAAGETVMGHVADGEWHEMSTLERYLEANLRLMSKRGHSIVTGERCAIEDGASVEEAVLWDDVTVERGARVRRSVLADGVRIPKGAIIERSVVVRRDRVKEFERGEIAGDNIVVRMNPSAT